ncbi:MAG TPA: hypothetical protein VGO93_25090 [Candidatus Xenobia bacterium]|jgi:hypothetical protein
MTSLLIFQPVNQPGAASADLRFGGLPVCSRRTPFEWPMCKECKKPLQFTAQIPVDKQLLLVFLCQNDPGMCESWDANSGANRCVFVGAHDVVAVQPPPQGETHMAQAFAGTVETVDTDYDTAREARKEQAIVGGQLGGTPAWIQGDETPVCDQCQTPMQFVAQFEEIGDANFGSAGCAYVFQSVCHGPAARVLTQC